MMILNIVMFLILFGVLILVGLPQSASLLTGILAFIAAVGIFMGISYVFTWGFVFPGVIPVSLFFAALVEEVCKFLGAILRRNDDAVRVRHGWGVGLGFAGAEHLFFLFLAPGMFALRLVFTTGLHVGTTALYTMKHSRWRRIFTDGLTLLMGTTVHGLYNFLLQGLDQRPFFW